MISISSLKSAAGSAQYFSHDDYYSEKGSVPGEWLGSGAKEAGLSGTPDSGALREVLEGKLPNGDEISKGPNGEHRPGWDTCFAPDKSVSVAALVLGDERVAQAHMDSVKAAVNFLEKECGVARVRDSNGIHLESAKLVAGAFTHESSRAQDPQLHTHCVIANAAQTQDGKWRALESKPIFEQRAAVDAYYKSELAGRLQELGYKVDVNRSTGDFRLSDIPKEVCDAFSKRANEIEAALKEHGLTRETTTAEHRGAIAAATRDNKEYGNKEELRSSWQETARNNGFGAEKQAELRATTEARAGSAEWTGQTASRISQADAAVRIAAEKLTERNSVVSAADLRKEANQLATGRASPQTVDRAIKDAVKAGRLVDRNLPGDQKGFTTDKAIAREDQMTWREVAGRNSKDPMMEKVDAYKAVAKAEAADAAKGKPWNEGQREAAAGVLTSRNTVTAVQGLAGTAKTSTVLKTVAEECKQAGREVIAIAPTASAARELGDALKCEAKTLASYLGNAQSERNSAQPREWGADPKPDKVLIVDEASMISTKDMNDLLRNAIQDGARVILAGDKQQMGSVEAGRAFEQMQALGMQTHHLTEIVRQSNASLKEAVHDAMRGDMRSAMDKVVQAGGRVHEIASKDERYAAIARDFVDRSPEQRQATLVLDNTRAGREGITEAIRAELKDRGELGREATVFKALERRDLTSVESKMADSYNRGDVVMFSRSYENKDVGKGETYRVKDVNTETGTVRLEGKDGKQLDWKPDAWGGARSEAFTERDLELRVGDRIAFTRNDREKGVTNNEGGRVIAVDAEKGTATVKSDRGAVVTLRNESQADSHIRHGYVDTSYSAQGKTAKEVLMSADSRSQATNQRSEYVQVSRAVDNAAIYTDSKEKLHNATTERSGEKAAATDGRVHSPRSDELVQAARDKIDAARTPGELSQGVRDLNAAREGEKGDAQGSSVSEKASQGSSGKDADKTEKPNSKSEASMEA